MGIQSPSPRTIWVGLDFGFYPAAVFAQQTGRGQWHILDEICPEDMSTPAFARAVKTRLGELLTGPRQRFRVYGDPSGSIRSAAREDKKNVYQILRANGLDAYPAPLKTNDPTIRIETVKAVLDRSVDGNPGILVSPNCAYLVKGFRGSYCYRRIGTSGAPRFEVMPSKNKYSHPHDTLQYLFLGAGEGRALTESRTSSTKKAIAKTGWNPFGKKKRRQRSQRI